MILIAEFSKGGGYNSKPSASSPLSNAAPSKFDTNASKALNKKNQEEENKKK